MGSVRHVVHAPIGIGAFAVGVEAAFRPLTLKVDMGLSRARIENVHRHAASVVAIAILAIQWKLDLIDSIQAMRQLSTGLQITVVHCAVASILLLIVVELDRVILCMKAIDVLERSPAGAR
jgi:hypothetical protein